jgi:hypothetical protein
MLAPWNEVTDRDKRLPYRGADKAEASRIRGASALDEGRFDLFLIMGGDTTMAKDADVKLIPKSSGPAVIPKPAPTGRWSKPGE